MKHEYYFNLKNITISKLNFNKQKNKYYINIIVTHFNQSEAKTFFTLYLLGDYKKSLYYYKKLKQIFGKYKLRNSDSTPLIFDITKNYPVAIGIQKKKESIYDRFFLLFQHEYLEKIPKDLLSEYLWIDLIHGFKILDFGNLVLT